jgi:tetratricopeptide (TPR) repeat protein
MSRSLSGKASGVNITNQPGASSSVTVRGVNSISSNSQPLYIVDGVPIIGNPITGDSTTILKPEDIDAIQVLNADSGAKLYGSRAANGLIIITTKKGKETNQEAINELNNQISEKIELRSWNLDTPYIKILEKEPTVETAYKKYLEIRNAYSNSPSFYLDVADFFDKKENPQTAIMILTNLIEVELDNHELMKALAYKLEYFKQYDLAVIVYKKVLELRPEDPQSYRDLALAYEQDGEIQKSFNLLYMMYNGELLHKDGEERYYGIEHIAYMEITRLVTKYKKKLKLTKVQRNSFNEIPVDVRVVIDWNHNDTDIDLWVIDPHGEKASYKNTETKIGGRMSEDLTEGYGPEEFMLKKAVRGEYKIMVDYYSDDVQKISGPTILKVTLFTNYGRKNELKKIIIVRLDKEEDKIEIGKLKF